LQAEIRRLAAGTNRGKRAPPAVAEAMLGAIASLEALNPTPSPAASPLLEGRWVLVYQAPSTPAAAADRGSTLEGPFLAAFQPLTRGAVRARANLQAINLKEGRVDNTARFSLLGRWDGSLNIVGSAVARPDGEIVDVEFSAFELRFGTEGGAPVARVPLGAVKPKGWLRTTYLDDRGFRLGRGDKGSVFVAVRAGDAGGEDGE
jgi:hypothetical protein